jgi:hypothetical protein
MIRFHGTVERRKTIHGVPGWIITTPTTKEGLGFFAPNTEIQKGFKPKEDDAVTFVRKSVDGRRQASGCAERKSTVESKGTFPPLFVLSSVYLQSCFVSRK